MLCCVVLCVRTNAVSCEAELLKLATLFNEGLQKKEQTTHKFHIMVISMYATSVDMRLIKGAAAGIISLSLSLSYYLICLCVVCVF